MSKQKPIFHTFELGGREITLCVKRTNDFMNQELEYSASEVSVGYSVKVKEDKFNQELAEKISSGRAESKARLSADIIGISYLTSGTFKGIAKTWERRITFNPTQYIKGIKVEESK